MAPIPRILELAPAVLAHELVRRHEDAGGAPRFARRDPEAAQVPIDRPRLIEGKARRGERRRRSDHFAGERGHGARFALHDNVDFTQAVADAAVEPVAMRQTVDEGAKANALHVPGQDEAPRDCR